MINELLEILKDSSSMDKGRKRQSMKNQNRAFPRRAKQVQVRDQRGMFLGGARNSNRKHRSIALQKKKSTLIRIISDKNKKRQTDEILISPELIFYKQRTSTTMIEILTYQF